MDSSNMLYNDLQEIGTRIASYAVTLYGLDQLGLDKLIGGNDTTEVLAVKTAALLSGTEYLSDLALEQIGLRQPTKFGSDVEFFIKNFITNTAVYYAMDKLSIDEMFFKYSSSPEKKALVLAVVFTIINEISFKVLKLWGY